MLKPLQRLARFWNVKNLVNTPKARANISYQEISKSNLVSILDYSFDKPMGVIEVRPWFNLIGPISPDQFQPFLFIPFIRPAGGDSKIPFFPEVISGEWYHPEKKWAEYGPFNWEPDNTEAAKVLGLLE